MCVFGNKPQLKKHHYGAFFVLCYQICSGKMTAFNAWLLLAIYGLFASYILAKAVDADFAIVISQSIDSINMVIEYVRFWK